MLRKLMALAATTAMLGAHAAAYAVTSARAAVQSITGASASEENPPRIDGRTIQPSIPEPPERAPVARKVSTKASASKPGKSATKPGKSASKPGKSTSKPGKSTGRSANARPPKTKPARTKSRRGR
jgi:hypothetical protein